VHGTSDGAGWPPDERSLVWMLRALAPAITDPGNVV